MSTFGIKFFFSPCHSILGIAFSSYVGLWWFKLGCKANSKYYNFIVYNDNWYKLFKCQQLLK